jgi:predicted DNA-binding protein with PD1-like motif
MRPAIFGFLLTAAMTTSALSQTVPDPPQWVYTHELDVGTAPGMKVVELNPKMHSYQISFANGDDLIGGLEAFFKKNNMITAHFTGMGALDRAVIGWGDPIKTKEENKSAVKIYRLNEYMEVTSFVGDINRTKDGDVDVHGHIVVGLVKSGATYSGHLLNGHVRVMFVHLDSYEPLAATAAK